MELTLDVVAVAVLMGLMQAVKQIPWLARESVKWVVPFIAVALGVAAACATAWPPTGETALKGVALGLAAVGLYQVTIDPAKRLVEGGAP